MTTQRITFLLAIYEFISSVAGDTKYNSIRRYAKQKRDNANKQAAKDTPAPRIVGGTPANDGDFPSYVFNAGSGLCGGTLIYPDIVLTAAHCKGIFLDGVLIGGTQISGSGSVYIPVDSEYSHPDYDDVTENNDVMLVKLSSPSSAPLQPLNFDPNIPPPDSEVTAIGYGATSEGGTSSTSLLQVQLNVQTFEECDSYYNAIVDENMICTGVPGGGRDTCQGDSGGPLYTASNVQVGIVSFGDGCARDGVPGVFARISGFQDFINDGICDLSDDPPASCSDSPAPTPPLDNTEAPTIASIALGTLEPTIPMDASTFPAGTPSSLTPTPPRDNTEAPTIGLEPTITPSIALVGTLEPTIPTDASTFPAGTPSSLTPTPPRDNTEAPTIGLEPTFTPSINLATSEPNIPTDTSIVPASAPTLPGGGSQTESPNLSVDTSEPTSLLMDGPVTPTPVTLPVAVPVDTPTDPPTSDPPTLATPTGDPTFEASSASLSPTSKMGNSKSSKTKGKSGKQNKSSESDSKSSKSKSKFKKSKSKSTSGKSKSKTKQKSTDSKSRNGSYGDNRSIFRPSMIVAPTAFTSAIETPTSKFRWSFDNTGGGFTEYRASPLISRLFQEPADNL